MLEWDVLLYVVEIIASHVDKNVIDMVETNVSSANGAKIKQNSYKSSPAWNKNKGGGGGFSRRRPTLSISIIRLFGLFVCLFVWSLFAALLVEKWGKTEANALFAENWEKPWANVS